MRTAVLHWFDQAAAALRELMDRPWSLFFALLAVNAVAIPYAGIVHDSQLYSAQVLNRVENGAYADDLFFRYGSQDKYSLFSVAAAPVVRLLGVETGFFLLYLVFNSLVLLAVQRLLLRVVKDRLVVALSLLLLATTCIAYGGLDCLHVNERFVTPRLLAVALAVFGLEQMVKSRYKTALLLMGLAGLMHPLMTVGGVLVFAGWWMVERFGWRRTLLICAPLAAVVAAVLAYQPLGVRLFGGMDEEWREYTRRACPMNFPPEWNLSDWGRLGVAFAFTLGLAGMHSPEDRTLVRLSLLTAVVAVLALVGTFLAGWLPYALLLQGQPYRALWLLHLLQAPVGLRLAVNLWKREALGRVLATALIAYLGLIPFYIPLEFGVAAFIALGVAAYYFAAPNTERGAPQWLLRGVVVFLLIGLVAWIAIRSYAVLGVSGEALRVINGVEFSSLVLSCLGVAGWAALCLAAVLLAKRTLGLGSRFQLLAGASWLMVQTAVFIVLCANLWDAPIRHTADMQFVNRFLQEHRDGDQLATIYCPTGEIADVWFTAHAKSWFNRYQLAGNLFYHQTAIEGQRRALLVARFEQERLRRYEPFLRDEVRHNLEELYQTPFDVAPPTLDDLAAVCREDGVDYVVLQQRFDAPCIADNGSFFIYDCRQVRAALGERTTAVAFAHESERMPSVSVVSSKLP